MRTCVAKLLIGLPAALWFCGCGGNDDAKTTPTEIMANQVRPVPRADVAPAPRAAEPKTGRADAPSPLPPGTDPDDVFELGPVEPNFVVLGPEPSVKPTDVFAVTPPPVGYDSSVFAVVTPKDGASGPARSAHPSAGSKLPSGFKPLAEGGYSESGLPLRMVCEQDGSEMALVPGGPAVIGTNDGPADARPRVTVELDPYYIDVHEVTLSQYEEFRKSWRESKKRLLDSPANAGADSMQPAVGVPWGDARNYARWLGKELPTEAQWEKAARGEPGFEHPWGNGRALWARPRTQEQIDPVQSHPSDVSVYGVYDLAGNAREWCLDWYSDRGHQEAAGKGASELLNWQGVKYPSAPNLRVVKGNGPGWNAWHRVGVNMAERPPTAGFRCVLRLKADEKAPANKSRAAEF